MDKYEQDGLKSMGRFIHSLKIFWRAERLLKEQEFKLITGRLQFVAIASLSAVSGLVMLNVAVFFALSVYWGYSLAALAISGLDFVLAVALVLYAGSLKTGIELEMVKEVRDTALNDIEEEAALAGAEIVALKEQTYKFMRNPVEALLPSVVGPMLAVFADKVITKNK